MEKKKRFSTFFNLSKKRENIYYNDLNPFIVYQFSKKKKKLIII